MWNITIAVIAVVVAVILYYTEQKPHLVHSEGIVFITGASSGIGRHAAEYLADNSNYLILAGVRKESDAQDIDSMNKKNLKSIIVDVNSHESIVSAVATLKNIMSEKQLALVGLVNNAGVTTSYPIEFQDIEDAKRVFDTNFFGTLDLTQQTLPMLRESKGRVVMVSSMAGFVSGPFSGVYSATKFAMEAVSDALRREVLPYEVSVSVVQPGFVKTPIIRKAMSLFEVAAGDVYHKMVAVYPAFAKQAEKNDVIEAAEGPATTTTPAIVDAITSQFPKTRYKVAGALGLSATTLSWVLWLLTDRLSDLLF